MKLKNTYFYTLREDPNDEDSIGSKLLVKAGFIKKTSAGIYMMLPLGLKVQSKIENIIRKNMNKAGALELRMPALIASEYYAKSGRLDGFGASMFRLKDRNGADFCLGPTHEELFVEAAKPMIRSYKSMPFNIYQFETKFRDEPRARFGLVRVKEFLMKDAYSFDADPEGLDKSYKLMFDAYKDSFDEIGLNYRIVRADTGVMGGLLSEEFQAITPIGEDSVVYCDNCDYSSNIEVSECISTISNEEHKKIELVETPDQESIEDVAKFLNLPQEKTVKALLMNVDGKLVIFFIRGDRELNETKVLKLLQAKELGFANDELIATSNAIPGFTGPVGLNAYKVVDKEVLNMANFVTGANKLNYHYINTNLEDFTYDLVGDIVNVKEGDVCPKCGKPLKFTKGIEVGNTFKLGTKYSEAMNLTYLNKDNKLDYVWMGCYGIGLGRTMAAVVEQSHDDKGIIWPESVAPYKAIILTMSSKDETQNNLANKIYDELNNNGIECMLDDRDERPGVKFNDAELIGIPYRITVGRGAIDNKIELKKRNCDETTEINANELLSYLTK